MGDKNRAEAGSTVRMGEQQDIEAAGNEYKEKRVIQEDRAAAGNIKERTDREDIAAAGNIKRRE